MRTTFLAFLLCLLSACSGPEYPMKIYVEVGQFDLYQSTAKAAETWNEELGRTAVLFVSTGDERVGKWDCDVVRVVVESLDGNKVGLCSKRAIGPHCGITIRIKPDNVGNVSTLIHEMGHALGVEHNRLKESYMYYAETDEPQTLLADDLLAADHTLDSAE